VAYAEDRNEVIQRAIHEGVSRMLCVSQDMLTCRNILSWVNKYPELYMSIGFHPHVAKDFQPEMMNELRELAKLPKIVAIGESGLDYHYDFSPVETQKQVLQQMFELAAETGLPIIIHSRESDEDIIPFINEFKGKVRGVIHCFSGNPVLLDAALKADYFISITGIVTFKKADDLRQAVKRIPLDRLLTETDSPYLSPIPFRGKRNEPAYVIKVTHYLADLFEMPYANFAEDIMKNANTLLGIPIP
jgi:TatD DNase family protein